MTSSPSRWAIGHLPGVHEDERGAVAWKSKRRRGPSLARSFPNPRGGFGGPSQPPRVRLTRDAIVDAALRVLDRGGLEGLSMRRVGEKRGPVRPRSTGTFETRKSRSSCCSSG
jgi:hypothetical protein